MGTPGAVHYPGLIGPQKDKLVISNLSQKTCNVGNDWCLWIAALVAPCDLWPGRAFGVSGQWKSAASPQNLHCFALGSESSKMLSTMQMELKVLLCDTEKQGTAVKGGPNKIHF